MNEIHNVLTHDSDEDKNFRAFPEALSAPESGLTFPLKEKKAKLNSELLRSYSSSDNGHYTYTQENNMIFAKFQHYSDSPELFK